MGWHPYPGQMSCLLSRLPAPGSLAWARASDRGACPGLGALVKQEPREGAAGAQDRLKQPWTIGPTGLHPVPPQNPLGWVPSNQHDFCQI